MSEAGRPVWLRLDGRPVAVRAILDCWNVYDEYGISGLAAFAWRVELENSQRWFVMRNAVRSAAWLGERAP
jgi:hypothetical protein